MADQESLLTHTDKATGPHPHAEPPHRKNAVDEGLWHCCTTRLFEAGQDPGCAHW